MKIAGSGLGNEASNYLLYIYQLHSNAGLHIQKMYLGGDFLRSGGGGGWFCDDAPTAHRRGGGGCGGTWFIRPSAAKR